MGHFRTLANLAEVAEEASKDLANKVKVLILTGEGIEAKLFMI
jgi:hypothetical protein